VKTGVDLIARQSKSSTLAYRRCELVRVNGTEMEVQFPKGKHAKKRLDAEAKDGASMSA
jgi:hypothetical protein